MIRGICHKIRRIATTLTILLLIGPTLPSGGEKRVKDSGRMGNVPPLVLWAWERPEDLRFINPKNVAVAFLATTIDLRGPEVVFHPRQQTLLVPDQTKMIAVVRINASADAALNVDQRERSVATALSAASLRRVSAVQIDFDATLSQRAFYRDLLTALRRQLPRDKALSITALASWCLKDDWVSDLPVDEAVPMLFRMGPGAREVVSRLAAGRDFGPSVCKGSVGISTDEPWAFPPKGRRLYAFRPKSWTNQAATELIREIHQ